MARELLSWDNLERQRAQFEAAGLDVDDTVLGPRPYQEAPDLDDDDPRDWDIGRIHIGEREPTSAWDDRAKCWTERHDPMLFFPLRSSTVEEINQGKRICQQCPVRWECLAYSVLNWEKVGIWGGYGEIERREIRRELKRWIEYGVVDRGTNKVRPPTREEITRHLKIRWGKIHSVPRGAGSK